MKSYIITKSMILSPPVDGGGILRGGELVLGDKGRWIFFPFKETHQNLSVIVSVFIDLWNKNSWREGCRSEK